MSPIHPYTIHLQLVVLVNTVVNRGQQSLILNCDSDGPCAGKGTLVSYRFLKREHVAFLRLADSVLHEGDFVHVYPYGSFCVAIQFDLGYNDVGGHGSIVFIIVCFDDSDETGCRGGA